MRLTIVAKRKKRCKKWFTEHLLWGKIRANQIVLGRVRTRIGAEVTKGQHSQYQLAQDVTDYV
jgi:hypothetical protein